MNPKTLFGLLIATCIAGQTMQAAQAEISSAKLQCPKRTPYYIYNKTNVAIKYDLVYKNNLSEEHLLLSDKKQIIDNSSSKALVGFYIFAQNGATECVYDIFCRDGKWQAIQPVYPPVSACSFDSVNTFTITP